MRWMDEAWSLVGQKEIGGPAANPKIIELFHDAGMAEFTSDETAWCAAFVSACLARSGIAPLKGYDAVRARSYAAFGTEIDLETPRVGAIAVLATGEAGSQRHTGFVTGWSRTHIMILGGNQANSVNVTPFERVRLVALRWPAPAVAPHELKHVSSIVKSSRDIEADGVKALATETVLQTAAQAAPKQEAAFHWIDQATRLQGKAEAAASFMAFTANHWWLLLALGGAFFGYRIFLNTRQIAAKRADDQNTGAHVDRAAEGAGA